MKALVLLLEEGAPSFCYHASPEEERPALMSQEVLEAALAWAAERDLALQVIGGRQGISPALRQRLQGHPHVCYLAAGCGELEPDDVPVLRADRPQQLTELQPNRHPIAILRVPLPALETWPQLFVELTSRVQRVVLVPLELPRWKEEDLQRYQRSLGRAAEQLLQFYLADNLVELSAISDRMLLSAPAECAAGIDHLTVAPSGELHLCPAFAQSGGAPAVGRIGEEPQIANAQLLRRDHAPICSICDAHHCRRCLYLNQTATLELNTPPWQACQAAHLEREASRQLLGRLQERGLLRDLPPIGTVDYQDPFETLTDRKIRSSTAAKTFAYLELPLLNQEPLVGMPAPAEAPRPERTGTPVKENVMDKGKPVGRVSPEERDQIRDLFLRKSALTELFLSLSKLDAASLANSPLYDKVIRDMGEVTVKFQSWWEEKAKSYGWESRPGGSWNVDFDSCEIFLV